MSLKVEKVVKRFGEKTAVNAVSFEVDGAGVFGLLGTNGAGKTTTIRMILGIHTKDEGTITWKGKPVGRETRGIGYLPEERGIYAKTRVEEQLIYFGKLRGMTGAEARKSVRHWFERLEMSQYAQKTAETLSKGNQQKVQLISALIHQPELIILDEPLSGLDPINTDLFKGVIHELIRDGKTIIMSSHQMSAVEEYCRNIMIMKDGNDLLSGDLRQIKRGYGRNHLRIHTDADIRSLAQKEGILLLTKTAEGYDFRISQESQAHRLLEEMIRQKMSLSLFEVREPSLHEIFVEKVGAAQ